MASLEERAALAAGYEVKHVRGVLWAKRPGQFSKFEPFRPCVDMHQCGQLLIDHMAVMHGKTPFEVLPVVVEEVVDAAS